MLQSYLPPQTALIILLVFGLFWLFLGWWLGRKNRSLDDFMLAGRNVGFALATATAMATWVTSNTTMVAPQLTYQLGVWGMVGYSLGAVGLILFAPLAMRIKSLMPNGFTSGDFVRIRYGNFAWRIFLVISLCYSIGWLISLGMAGGILVNALSGLDYTIGMSLILLICVSYTLLGGLRAVIATDFIQTLIILFGIIWLAWLVMDNLSINALHQAVQEERPELLNLLFPAAIMFLFNNLFFGVGEIFHSNVWWSRALAFGNGVGFKAYLLAGILWMPIPIVAGFIALAAPALGIVVPGADMVGPLIAGQLLGTAGAIVVFIVVFSALASSLDSVLAATSDLITQDIYRGHIRSNADEHHYYKAGKAIILILGLITWLLCLPKLATLGALLHFTGAFVASAIWPIVFGLYDKRTNGLTAALSMILGTLMGLAGYFLIGFYVAALLSAVVSLVVILIGTYLNSDAFDFAKLGCTKTNNFNVTNQE